MQGRVGLVLGSGAARGWAHVGAIRALEDAGLRPSIVCGTSAGALVGALYAAGRLDQLEAWGRQLDWRQVVGYFDPSLRGGLIKARKLVEFLSADLPGRQIEGLDLPFAIAATDLESGREIWLRRGSLEECLRAAIALPGLVAPVRVEGRWLVDGGLVNPVPVSLCRAMGADSVIAVDLNTTLMRRHVTPAVAPPPEDPPQLESDAPDAVADASSVRTALREFVADMRERVSPREPGARDDPPSIYDVVASSLNVMQMRITRSRMAGDPPDLLVTPRLHDFALLDFDRAEEAIDEGRRAVAQALTAGHPDDLFA